MTATEITVGANDDGNLAQFAPLPTFRLNTSGACFEERYDIFSDLWGKFYDINLNNRSKFEGLGQSWEVDTMLAGYAAYGNVSLSFDPRRGEYDDNQLLLKLNLSGHSIDSFEHVMGAGWMVLLGFGSAWSAEYQDYDYVGVLLPAEAVGLKGPLLDAPTLHSDTPLGRVLRTALLAFMARLPHASAGEAPQLASDLAEVVRATMLTPRSHITSGAFARARKLAIQSHIDQNLLDFSLTPDGLSHLFGMSRASLYRQFHEYGGVERYIRDRRLLRTLRILNSTDGRRGHVRRVAESHGFTDAGNFNRMFRGRFGYSPNEVAKSDSSVLPRLRPRPSAPGAPLIISQMSDWLLG